MLQRVVRVSVGEFSSQCSSIAFGVVDILAAHFLARGARQRHAAATATIAATAACNFCVQLQRCWCLSGSLGGPLLMTLSLKAFDHRNRLWCRVSQDYLSRIGDILQPLWTVYDQSSSLSHQSRKLWRVQSGYCDHVEEFISVACYIIKYIEIYIFFHSKSNTIWNGIFRFLVQHIKAKNCCN